MVRERRLARRLDRPTGKPCVVVPRTYFGSAAPKVAQAFPGTHPDWQQGSHEPGWRRRVPILTSEA